MNDVSTHTPEPQAQQTAALPDRLTPLQSGRTLPPPVTPGGQEIRITIQQAGQRPLSILIRTPARKKEVPALQSPETEPAKDKTKLMDPAATVTHSHVAGIGISPVLQSQQQIVPSTTLILNHLFQTRSEQMDLMEKRLAIHESVDHAMKEAFSSLMQSLDPAVYTQINHIVQQVMADLLSGSTILDTPPEHIMKVRDAIVDEAAMQVKNQGKTTPLNAHSLRNALENHNEVRSFRQNARPGRSKGAGTGPVRYHPNTRDTHHEEDRNRAEKDIQGNERNTNVQGEGKKDVQGEPNKKDVQGKPVQHEGTIVEAAREHIAAV